ncbi:MAG: SdiA-regulated domain-containing protein [Deltaproteobacteria bacterium]|nr:SdiA-regulated domain-containing protein [Deltaproteobacteria bacterium]
MKSIVKKVCYTLAGVLAVIPTTTFASISSLDLGDYTLTGSYALPTGTASEASAVTWNWTTDTLFVLGDEGDALVEVSKTGTQLSSMTLTGFKDTEGLTYIGGSQFVLTEERLRSAYLLNFMAGTSVDRGSLSFANLGDTVENIGIEGISYDPQDGSFITVKEKMPQEVNKNTITFGGSSVVTSLFTPNLGLLDLSDVQVLSTVTSAGSADEDNLLILSQESSKLFEVSRTGAILSQLNLGALGLPGSTEGVTIDRAGIVYLVAEEGINEGPTLYTLSPTPVPLPGALVLLGSGLAGLAGVDRRRKNS